MFGIYLQGDVVIFTYPRADTAKDARNARAEWGRKVQQLDKL